MTQGPGLQSLLFGFWQKCLCPIKDPFSQVISVSRSITRLKAPWDLRNKLQSVSNEEMHYTPNLSFRINRNRICRQMDYKDVE